MSKKVSLEVGNRNLMKLAAILDKADAEHRKKGEPTYKQEAVAHGCGTPACAIGHWMANVESQRYEFFKLRENGGLYRFRSNRAFVDIIGLGERTFHLTEEQSDDLFGSEGCDEAQTAKQAADYIRKFVRGRCPTLGHGDLYCERYATWEEAERGHASAVAWVQAGKAYRPAAAAAWDNVKWRVRVAWRRFWRVARGVTKQ